MLLVSTSESSPRLLSPSFTGFTGACLEFGPRRLCRSAKFVSVCALNKLCREAVLLMNTHRSKDLGITEMSCLHAPHFSSLLPPRHAAPFLVHSIHCPAYLLPLENLGSRGYLISTSLRFELGPANLCLRHKRHEKVFFATHEQIVLHKGGTCSQCNALHGRACASVAT